MDVQWIFHHKPSISWVDPPWNRSRFFRENRDTGTVGRARGRDLGRHAPGAQRGAGFPGVHLQLESLVDHLGMMVNELGYS